MITSSKDVGQHFIKLAEYVVQTSSVEPVYRNKLTNEKYYRTLDGMMVLYSPQLDGPLLDEQTVKTIWPEVLI